MLDNNGTIMLTPRVEFMGRLFFGTDFQEFIVGDKAYNELVRTVMLSGKPANRTYNINEQGVYTGFPVFLRDNNGGRKGNNIDNSAQKPQCSVFVITPFRDILSNLDELVSSSRIQTLVLLIMKSISLLLFGGNKGARHYRSICQDAT